VAADVHAVAAVADRAGDTAHFPALLQDRHIIFPAAAQQLISRGQAGPAPMISAFFIFFYDHSFPLRSKAPKGMKHSASNAASQKLLE